MDQSNILDNYDHFVDTLLSTPSKDLDVLISVLKHLDGKEGVNIAKLMTASAGLCSEAGEFGEICKKLVFQGKPLNADNKFHMLREMGDIAFYFLVACQALGISAQDVIAENVRKLESRYPGGHFNIEHSEIRKVNDL